MTECKKDGRNSPGRATRETRKRRFTNRGIVESWNRGIVESWISRVAPVRREVVSLTRRHGLMNVSTSLESESLESESLRAWESGSLGV